MRAPRALGLLGVALLFPAGTGAYETDAATLGRGAVWGFGRLTASPANPDSAPSGWAIDLGTPWLGTDLAVGRVHLQRRGRRCAVATEIAQWRAPIGAETSFAIAAQGRCGALHAGVAATLRALQFAALPVFWEVAPRLGLGWRGARWCAAGVLAVRGDDGADAEITYALLARPWAPLVWLAQTGHAPGRHPDVRLGCEWRGGAWCARAGYDAGSAACSIGFGWRGDTQSLAWGAVTHPELGWSHAWTYARP